MKCFSSVLKVIIISLLNIPLELLLAHIELRRVKVHQERYARVECNSIELILAEVCHTPQVALDVFVRRKWALQFSLAENDQKS